MVSTADVKPSPTVGPGVVAAFEMSCETLREAGRAAPSLQTVLRHAHPWFGPLDAAQWQVMGGMHLGLHRRQIDLIRAGLARSERIMTEAR